MDNSGVAIKYGDFAVGAKESFVPYASEQEEFATLQQLQQYNLDFPNYANPCELYSVVLDGAAMPFPSTPDTANLGLWSKQLSNKDGTFKTPIVLTLTAEGQYSSQGFTLTFDTHNNIFCNDLNIKWYLNDTMLFDEDFNPDNAFYFCHKKVDNFNKIVITFSRINMPYNRLKLRAVDYGYGTYFYGNELRKVKNIQEVDAISSEIAINTCDFTLDSKSKIEYSFQTKQPLSVYFNGELKATMFVKASKRTAERLWQIQAEDYIGFLDTISFYGGMYFNYNAFALLEEIFNVASVPYKIDETLDGLSVTGYIPFTTCREALKQVVFATGAVVDTSNSDKVKVYMLSDELTQTIPLERIMQGQNFDDEDTVTGVEVIYHSYWQGNESTELYNAEESGTGESIFVKFSEPIHSLSVLNGEILTEHVNYAVINANDGCKLTGIKYIHGTQTKRQNKSLVLANEIEKIVAVENATLVSAANIDSVLTRCFEWLTKNNTVNLKIVEGKHVTGGDIVKFGEVKFGEIKFGGETEKVVTYDEAVNVGDIIECATEYLGNLKGRVIKETFTLNGGIIIKEAVMK